MIYLDNAATTSVVPEAAKTIYDVLNGEFGNPSSLYSLGISARKIIDASRESLAGILGCSADEIYFTSCGTESNNLAILGAARARKSWGDHVIVSGFEHPAVQNTVESLKQEGFRVTVIMPDRSGHIDTDAFLDAVEKKTVLATCMRVNNEVGTIIDTPRLAAEVKKRNRRTAFHCDCVQAFAKHSTLLDGSIDTLSVSAHKIHGPKGIGLLYVRKGFNLQVVQHGGGQEKGLRSGTENTAYIAGFAAAAKQCADIKKNLVKVAGLRDELKSFVEKLPEAVINSPEDASPYIFNFSLPGYRSETLLHFFEERDIYVSSGSACGHGERSHTLSAMGLEDSLMDSSLRISFSEHNTMDDVRAFEDALTDAIATIRRKD